MPLLRLGWIIATPSLLVSKFSNLSVMQQVGSRRGVKSLIMLLPLEIIALAANLLLNCVNIKILKYCYLSTIKLLPICLIYSITTGEGTKNQGIQSL